MQAFKMYAKKEIQNSSFIVGWNEDVANLGTKVIDYLNEKLSTEELGEIEPMDFFPLGGVAVENDITQFPESKFYYSYEKNVVILKSNAPRAEWHKFLNSVLDVAEHYCHAKELYTIGGMVSLSAHTSSRELLAVSNLPAMKNVLGKYHVDMGMDYETPPGQRPTLSSFLLWVAKNRGIPAASLWVPIPFYLVSTEDFAASKKVVDFFDKRFALGIDLKELDDAVASQNEKLAEIRFSFPEVDSHIRNLESNVALSQEDSEKLAKDIEEYLKRID
ncbi:MAG TPA: PAC2 family protein [Dehalococcoidia bacterium]|nr:PAC2 family protein [Dehalococcoidia bacterium]